MAASKGIIREMQGRPALLAKALITATALCLLAGCEAPRVKSMESVQSATLNNPPRDFNKEPIDPYSWGGIAMATGGRDARTTYGAMSPGSEDGVDEVYLQGAKKTPPANNTSTLYMVPDPRFENKAEQFLGSTYIGNEVDHAGYAKVIARGGVHDADPKRAGMVRPKKAAAASE